MEIQPFNLNQENLSNFFSEKPYFLASQDTYKQARIRHPFRTIAYGIGITYKGEKVDCRIGSKDFCTQAGSLTTVGPGIVCRWMGQYNALHDTIYFTEDLFKDSLSANFLRSLSCFSQGGQHVIQVSEADMGKFSSLFLALKKVLQDKDLVPGVIYAILMLVKQCQEQNPSSRAMNNTQTERITLAFKKLLQDNFTHQKEVGFYATQLHVSPKYLSEILLKETGKTAKALIQEQVLFEARSLLRQSTLPVQEISRQLGFEDTSYFTKAFKKLEGISPLKYRSLLF